ncbi:MAG: virulence factor family protein [Hyalangium sp.]|uniref:virulence factor family protein n=1 Tax=Hyalangium sp. TaxID=2028555 RepID=UPI0038998B8B
MRSTLFTLAVLSGAFSTLAQAEPQQAGSAPPAAAQPAAKPPAPSEKGPMKSITFDRFGTVALTHPQGAPRSVAIVLFTGPAADTTAKTLANAGALVLIVDTAHYLEAFRHAGKCAYPAGDLEALAQYTEKTLDFPEYLHPILVGSGPGSAIAYASLAQAPENTFLGAMSIGFRPEVAQPIPTCKAGGLPHSRSANGKAEVFGSVPALNAPWRLIPGLKESKEDLERQQAFIQNMQGAQLVPLPAGPQSPEARQALIQQSYTELATPSAPATPAPVASAPAAASDAGVPSADASTPSQLESVTDLPLIEVPAPTPSPDSFALLISGDGGWAGIDRQLAAALNTQGLSVVGLDSLRYFWKRRTPEDTARDVARAVTHYLAAWHTKSAVLMGYSRGADVLPATVARLPPELRQRVKLVALVAPGRIAEFEVHVTDLLGGGGGDYEILPEAQALGGMPLLCIYGDAEIDESLCPLLKDMKGAKSLMLPGGHHFGGDYNRVARAIIDSLGP